MTADDTGPHRWVVVVDSPFLPARGGGEQEHFGILRAAALADVLAVVVMPSDGPIDLQPYREALGAVPFVLTPRRTSPLRLLHPRDPYVVASRPAPRWLTRRVTAVAADVDGVLTTSYKSWRIGAQLAHDLELPMVLRHHNREGDYHASLARSLSGLRRWVTAWEAVRVRSDERALDRAPWLRGIADISMADAEDRRRAGARRVVHVPPFVRAGTATPGTDLAAERVPADPARLLFLGALDIPTNTAGLDWLLEQVWPLVKAGSPTVVLDVVGRRAPSGLKQRLARLDGVELHADVPDLAPYLARTAVALNPAVTGSGVNIKLVDYLEAGLPVVTTSLATRALPLQGGVDVEVADDPQSFATAVLALLQDPVRAAAIARTGRRTLRRLLDPEVNLASLRRLLAAGPPGGGETSA